MTSTLISPHAIPRVHRAAGRRRSSVDPRLVIAVALYLAVLIATGVAVAVASRSVPDISSFYVTVP